MEKNQEGSQLNQTDKRPIVSFDFDDTIVKEEEIDSNDPWKHESTMVPNEKVIKAIHTYKEQGYKIIVVTSRFEHLWGEETIEDLKKLNLYPDIIEEVYFTNHNWKQNTLKKLNVQIHYDDNKDELRKIAHTGIKGQLVS